MAFDDRGDASNNGRDGIGEMDTGAAVAGVGEALRDGRENMPISRMKFTNHWLVKLALRLLGAIGCVTFSYAVFRFRYSIHTAIEAGIWWMIGACMVVPPFVGVGLIFRRLALGTAVGIVVLLALLTVAMFTPSGFFPP